MLKRQTLHRCTYCKCVICACVLIHSKSEAIRLELLINDSLRLTTINYHYHYYSVCNMSIQWVWESDLLVSERQLRSGRLKTGSRKKLYIKSQPKKKNRQAFKSMLCWLIFHLLWKDETFPMQKKNGSKAYSPADWLSVWMGEWCIRTTYTIRLPGSCETFPNKQHSVQFEYHFLSFYCMHYMITFKFFNNHPFWMNIFA